MPAEARLEQHEFPVARDEMTREILNKLFPLVPILRRRDVLFVPERMEGVWIGSKFFGSEAELDEGADMILE